MPMLRPATSDAAPAWPATRNRAPARPLRAEHISPTTGSPASRACATSASPATGQPPFCGSSPILTWRKQSGRRPPGHRLGQRGHQRGAVDRMHGVEQGDGVLGLVGLELARGGGADRRGARAGPATGLRLLHPFSPKSRWPAAISSSTASTGWVFETAIRVTSSARRPARRRRERCRRGLQPL